MPHQNQASRHHRRLLAQLLLLAGILSVGCQQQMAKQPSYRPYEGSDFFRDKRSARPLVEGTVDRSWRDDPALTSGKLPAQARQASQAALVGVLAQPSLAWLAPLTVSLSPVTAYRDTFPFEVTAEVLERGQERYNIFCSVCHDYRGTGRGVIVLRGFTEPPSFIDDTVSRGLGYEGARVPLREAPVGYYFHQITHGFGAMPDYSSQIPPQDRWAIVAYVRALQYSQNVPVSELSDEEREKISEGGEQ